MSVKRRIWPALVFAILGLIAALWVSVDEGPKHEEGQAWESFSSQDIRSISLTNARYKVKFTPLSISYGWIEYLENGKDKEPQVLLAGPKGKDLWFDLSPLWATKVMGDASRLKLSEYGLENDVQLFTVELNNNKNLVYRVGQRGFQSSDFFTLDMQKNAVFLWNRETISLLERAPARLAVESPTFLDPAALNKIVLIYKEKIRAIVRQSKDWREGQRSVYPEEPLFKWMERVSKLKIEGYRKAGSPAGEELFRLDLEGDNAFALRFYFDAGAKVYLISFGDDKPQLILDEKSFSPLYDEFRAGTLFPKI
ncbi:MAG: hypothetical protein EOP07_09360 [Proteobacteria bacterium]|nr:MAG: hypothetical protein EOP07_09360 [Pseudomonadota bacterium]